MNFLVLEVYGDQAKAVEDFTAGKIKIEKLDRERSCARITVTEIRK